jgi:hypothetical protein
MAEGATARALREALGKTIAEQDRAAVQLARKYAALLDQATPASKYRAPLDKLASAVRRNPEAADALERIRDALGAHSVLSDLGPKYLAVLAQLGLTPAARGVKAGTGPASGQQPSTRNELKDAREKRERQRRGLAADPG